MKFESTLDFAAQLDANDPLRSYRDQFYIPTSASGKDSIYFVGNSLGLQPKSTAQRVQQELDDWKKYGVEGHFEAKNPWVSYHHLVKKSLGRLVGGSSQEVVAMNTLTGNLHAMMVSFYQPTPSRHKILLLNQSFPSDRYAIASQIAFHGYDPSDAMICFGPEGSEGVVCQEELCALIDQRGEEIALILIEGVSYITGQRFDLKTITNRGHARGCFVGTDLAHAVGNVELDLHDIGVDFAVWCSYKYLNGGPGCIAGAFVHDRHASNFDLPIFAGWWGHDEKKRFLMEKDFSPMVGIDRWQVSNIPIMTTACLQASLDIFDCATMPALVEKSKTMTGFLFFLLEGRLKDKISIVTPSNPEQRGCQLSLIIPGGKSGYETLIAKGVACDWREPNVVRIAPVPLYNTYQDVYRFVELLEEVL
ncbi:MAG: kynureninase [Deltaproteobacteria bacterium]|nr:kynureninase [Deltaproteobacteria bacterium]